MAEAKKPYFVNLAADLPDRIRLLRRFLGLSSQGAVIELLVTKFEEKNAEKLKLFVEEFSKPLF
jgi:hypothetical protein